MKKWKFYFNSNELLDVEKHETLTLLLQVFKNTYFFVEKFDIRYL